MAKNNRARGRPTEYPNGVRPSRGRLVYRRPGEKDIRVTLKDLNGAPLSSSDKHDVNTVNAAATRAAAIAIQRQNGDQASFTTSNNVGKKTIGKMVNEFIARDEYKMKARGSAGRELSPRYAEANRRYLEKFASVLGTLEAIDFTSQRAQMYFNTLSEKDSAATANRARAAISILFAWAKRELGDHWVTSNPVRETRLQDEQTNSHAAWPIEVMDVWLAYCASSANRSFKNIGLITQLGFLTGQRQGDFLKMVMPAGRKITFLTQKTGQPVGLPIDDVPGLASFIDGLNRPVGQPLVPNKHGNAYTPNGVKTVWHRIIDEMTTREANTLPLAVDEALQKSGRTWPDMVTLIRQQSRHGLRNHFGVNLFLNNPDVSVSDRLRVIQEIYGHTNAAMTMKYLKHIMPDIYAERLSTAFKGFVSGAS